MTPRRPAFDFSNTPVIWARNPEWAQFQNAASVWIPHLERFLNKVIARALKEIGDDAGARQLRRDARTFIRQEANHYAAHDAFNAVIHRDPRYDLGDLEEHFAREFEHLLATKSLGFLCAYCEGFETVSPAVAAVWLDDKISDLTAGARPEVMAFWKWHLAEEFEHRTVCFDIFKAIHGGYLTRLYGFFYQMRQLNGFSRMVSRRLLRSDRATMTPDEVKASKRREKDVNKLMRRVTVPYLVKALSPFHNPRRAREPTLYRGYIAELDAASR